MKITNIHKRTINEPLEKVSMLVEKLGSKDDKIWPYEKWPAIKFKDGLKVGSKGGHGLIRYTITKYNPSEIIQFQFTKPKGFIGIHEFRIASLSENETEIDHVIDIKLSFFAILQWYLFIRWLHDALIEDAFDKIENHFSNKHKETKWNFWVKLWRLILAEKRKTHSNVSLKHHG